MSVNAPIDLEKFENAVHHWFSNATGLETIWRPGSSFQPVRPFGSLRVTSGPVPVSPVWEERYTTDLDRPAGEEVIVSVCVPCQFTVSCQAYVGQPDAINPSEDARFYMTKAQSALMLPSVLARLREYNISVIRPGPVQDLSALVEDSYESRANMDVTFGATLSLDDYVGYIEKVHAVSESLGIDQVFGVV